MNKDNEQIVKEFGKQYVKVLQEAERLNYCVNYTQFEKLDKIIKFFNGYIKDCGGAIQSVLLTPQEIHGGLTANFGVFDISGDQVAKFCDVLKDASAVSIDATLDGEVCISLTVPDVFTTMK